MKKLIVSIDIDGKKYGRVFRLDLLKENWKLREQAGGEGHEFDKEFYKREGVFGLGDWRDKLVCDVSKQLKRTLEDLL